MYLHDKSLAVLFLLLSAGSVVNAQGIHYNLGRVPTQEEITAWDIAIHPEGKELPTGSGTAKEGAQLYAVKCASCHGPDAAGGLAPRLVGNNTATSNWPFATAVWDYINRAMPLFQEGSLKTDEVYAITAFLLYKNGTVREMDALDRNSLPKVRMPNQDGYVPPPLSQWQPGMPRLFKIIDPE